jgi:hypothetical protein
MLQVLSMIGIWERYRPPDFRQPTILVKCSARSEIGWPAHDRKDKHGYASAAMPFAESITNGGDPMQENKNAVARWFKEFWGNPWNPRIVDELALQLQFLFEVSAPRFGLVGATPQ